VLVFSPYDALTRGFTVGSENAFNFKYPCTNIVVVTSRSFRLTRYVARMEENKKMHTSFLVRKKNPFRKPRLTCKIIKWL
jgi:hypothetical protein